MSGQGPTRSDVFKQKKPIIDLHRWLGGSYGIPAAEQDDSEDSLPSRDDEER